MILTAVAATELAITKPPAIYIVLQELSHATAALVTATTGETTRSLLVSSATTAVSIVLTILRVFTHAKPKPHRPIPLYIRTTI